MCDRLDTSTSDESSFVANSEDHYRAIVESQAEMICRFRPDGTILFVNAAYARARGATPEALARMNFWEFIDETDRAEVRRQLDQLTAQTPEIRIENRFETAHGSRWMLWTNRGLAFDENGRALEVQSTGIDITERKLAEEKLRASQERQRIATNAAGLGVFEWNTPNDYAVWENERMYEIFGHSHEDGVFNERVFFESYLHPEDVVAFQQAFLEGVKPGGTLQTTCRIHRKSDGAERWISIAGNFTLNEEGLPLRLVGVVADITERRRAENALRHLNEMLEEHVAERTAQVRALAAQLTIAEQEERRRIAQILHDDLQQHIFGAQFQLRAIRNVLEANGLDDTLPQIESINETLKTSIHLTRQLSLDLSPPVLDAASVNEVIRWLATQMQQQHGLIVHVLAGDEIYLPDLDLRVLLLQAVRELLFNVVKHAGVSEVAVSLLQSDERIRVEVRDQGEGFSVDSAMNDATRSHGLWHVRQRLELIGGRMQIASTPGAGTRVIVDCPLRAEQFEGLA